MPTNFDRLIGLPAYDGRNIFLGNISDVYVEDGSTWAVIDDNYEINLHGCNVILNVLDDGFPREYARFTSYF